MDILSFMVNFRIFLIYNEKYKYSIKDKISQPVNNFKFHLRIFRFVRNILITSPLYFI